MNPTYSSTEILDFLHRLDIDELAILGEIITEEAEQYTIQDLSIIYANFARQVKRVAKKEAQKVMDRIWRVF